MDLLQWSINFLIKKLLVMVLKIFLIKELAELHKSSIGKINKRKVHSPFIDTILGTDLAVLQLISNVRFRVLLCVIDIYSKYAWVIPLKDKRGITITKAFQTKKKCKPNKIWIDKGSEFYNRSMRSWLEKNDIEMYSTHNEGKSVVTKRFIRTLKKIINT